MPTHVPLSGKLRINSCGQGRVMPKGGTCRPWMDQRRLADALVVIVGCGPRGIALAELMARLGVRRLRLIDDRRVKAANPGVHCLFDSEDARDYRFRAMAARQRLLRTCPGIAVEAIVERVSARNAISLFSGANLVLDGTDNYAARHIINQTCLELGIPWVFGGAVEGYGMMMNIVPGQTPCFDCVFGDSGPREHTNQREHVLPAAAHLVASLQASQAQRLLLGDLEYSHGLIYVDASAACLERLDVKSPTHGCPTCGRS